MLLKCNQNIRDKNGKKIYLIFWYKKNISRSNFENLVGQFSDDIFMKISANFYPNPKTINAQETF